MLLLNSLECVRWHSANYNRFRDYANVGRKMIAKSNFKQVVVAEAMGHFQKIRRDVSIYPPPHRKR